MRLSVHSFECRPPTQPQRDRPPPFSIVPQPQTGVPEPRAPLDRHWHHLGRYAAVPGLLSPSPELPGEAGTITPPPNQIRPGSSSADWGFWGRGLRESEIVFSRPPKSATTFLHSAPALDHLTKAGLRVAPWSTLRGRSRDQARRSLLLGLGPSRPWTSVFPLHLWQGRLKMILLSLFFYPSHCEMSTPRRNRRQFQTLERSNRANGINCTPPCTCAQSPSALLHFEDFFPYFRNTHCFNA